jgi:catechol 2,3-dioxygenase-like lactoylglutathione lyase family enzyme
MERRDRSDARPPRCETRKFNGEGPAMSVVGVDHINIRTTDPKASAKFYVDIFGFRHEQGPGVMGFERNWLYDETDRPIIHLRVMQADSDSTGPIDHVALACKGKAQIIERLKAHNVPHSVSDNLIPGLTQIFIKDPHGVPLELNFSGE